MSIEDDEVLSKDFGREFEIILRDEMIGSEEICTSHTVNRYWIFNQGTVFELISSDDT